jgi:outer membrane biosynthesis protein TonB
MKRDQKFLIISLTIHAIVLIVSVYIILPQSDRLTGIIENLNVDIFKIQATEKRDLPVKKQAPVEKPKEQTEIKTPKENPQNIVRLQSPDPAIISTLNSSSVASSERLNTFERKTETPYSPEIKTPESPKVTLTKNIKSTTKRQESELITTVDRYAENIGNKGKTTIYAIPSVGPLRAGYGYKGQSSRYIDAMSSVMPRGGVDQFAYIFPSLAQGIGKRVTQGKVDVVFIIDTTGSMEDNVIGVKNYIEHFVKPLEDMKIDVELGLVEFSDRDARKEKVYDLTDSLDKFRKWLDKTRFYGGRDLPESGYEAIVIALEKIKYRESAQKAIIFVSDSPQHDFDYDGKSRYTLDRIIAILNEQNVGIDVIGLDFLPMKQLAWGTGGQWKPIPGGDLRLDMPESAPPKIHSKLTASMLTLKDMVTVDFDSVVPDWIELSYKVLDPNGLKVIGALTYRKAIDDKSAKKMAIPVKFEVNDFIDRPGIYTLIYRTRDSYGNQNIYRQNFEIFIDS